MIVDKLNDIINGYSENSSLKNFCFYVKENIEEIEYMNINQLAKGCYVSKGQISKYTRQMCIRDRIMVLQLTLLLLVEVYKFYQHLIFQQIIII